MTLRATLLFSHDDRGRLSKAGDPSDLPAPRFYLGRSRHGNLWRFRSDLPRELVRDLARLAAREAPLQPGSPAPPERLQAFRNLLELHAPVERETRGPGFRFPAAALPTPQGDGAIGSLVFIDEANRELLQAGFPELVEDIPRCCPCAAVVEAGVVIAQCRSARHVEGLGAEAGIETAVTHRGRGLAPRVALAWARAIARTGAQPFYSTEWQNSASRAVASKLGLVQVGEDLNLH